MFPPLHFNRAKEATISHEYEVLSSQKSQIESKLVLQTNQQAQNTQEDIRPLIIS
ncbi:unnamed protein product, partial [Heterosigma akashiwo]